MRVNDRETTEEMKEKLGVSIATIYREIAALRKISFRRVPFGRIQ